MQKAFGSIGAGAFSAREACVAATTTTTAAAAAAPAKFGVFQNIHINLFPVRAAIDIGTGGLMSMAVGRVDAAHNALRDLMYQTQLPIQLVSANSASLSGSNLLPSSFVLSEVTRTDIRNKMRLLHGALRRDQYDGLSERAAVISWPLCEAGDSLALAEELTREFKVDVRVLGKTFDVDMPFFDSRSVVKSKKNMSFCEQQEKKAFFVSGEGTNGDDNSLQMLMQQLLRRRERRCKSLLCKGTYGQCKADDEKCRATSPEEQLKQLSFLAHAAIGKCVAPERMLVLTEDSERGLCILGIDKAESTERDITEGSGEDIVPLRADGEKGSVLSHVLPVDISTAQHILLTAVQRRSHSWVNNHELRSPNPVLWEEFLRLRDLLEEMISPTLPEWVKLKSKAGGFICGSSYNGGVFNVAARVAQQSNVTLDHLETHARMHYCGLTDVLLSVNYPDPTTVLPSAAIASALMRALETNRFEYLPEVGVPAALLIQPSLWMYSKRKKVRAALQKKSFFDESSLHRTFSRPHARENPTAVPGASWQQNQPWNPLSYENSTKGT